MGDFSEMFLITWQVQTKLLLKSVFSYFAFNCYCSWKSRFGFLAECPLCLQCLFWFGNCILWLLSVTLLPLIRGLLPLRQFHVITLPLSTWLY